MRRRRTDVWVLHPRLGRLSLQVIAGYAARAGGLAGTLAIWHDGPRSMAICAKSTLFEAIPRWCTWVTHTAWRAAQARIRHWDAPNLTCVNSPSLTFHCGRRVLLDCWTKGIK